MHIINENNNNNAEPEAKISPLYTTHHVTPCPYAHTLSLYSNSHFLSLSLAVASPFPFSCALVSFVTHPLSFVTFFLSPHKHGL